MRKNDWMPTKVWWKLSTVNRLFRTPILEMSHVNQTQTGVFPQIPHAFLEYKDIPHKEFVTGGRTVHSEYYPEVM